VGDGGLRHNIGMLFLVWHSHKKPLLVTQLLKTENGTNTRFCLEFRYFMPKIIDKSVN